MAESRNIEDLLVWVFREQQVERYVSALRGGWVGPSTTMGSSSSQILLLGRASIARRLAQSGWARAVYRLWHTALCELVNIINRELVSYRATWPAISPEPWLDQIIDQTDESEECRPVDVEKKSDVASTQRKRFPKARRTAARLFCCLAGQGVSQTVLTGTI